MTRKSLLSLAGFFLLTSLFAQTESPGNYRNFPLIVTIQFHSLSLPFRDLKANFSNIGLGFGTEVSFNGKHNWAQQLHAAWYRNKAVGNGLMLYSQAAWRPTVASPVFTEVKAGVGYLYAFRPVKSYRPENGTWLPVGKKGKGMLMLPAGVTFGYYDYRGRTYLAPFVSYQFLLVSGYNQSIPLVPETLIQIGTGIHFE